MGMGSLKKGGEGGQIRIFEIGNYVFALVLERDLLLPSRSYVIYYPIQTNIVPTFRPKMENSSNIVILTFSKVKIQNFL